MKKANGTILFFILMMVLASCMSSRKMENRIHELRSDSVSASSTDTCVKTVKVNDSALFSSADQQHASGFLTEKESQEELISEKVTESSDDSGKRILTADRIIYRKGDVARLSSYENMLKNQSSVIQQKQHEIDSLLLSERRFHSAYLSVKDSLFQQRDINTKDVRPLPVGHLLTYAFIWIVSVIGLYVYFCWKNKKSQRGT